MLTYGDGVSDVPVDKLLAFHRSRKGLVTLTAVRPPARFGALEFDGDRIRHFKEKSTLHEGWINGGFSVVEPAALEYIAVRRDVGARADGGARAATGSCSPTGTRSSGSAWTRCAICATSNRCGTLARAVEDLVTHVSTGLWDGLRGARIFMTGGTGFVGLAMLERLAAVNERLQLGATVVVLTRDPRQFAEREPELARHEWITATSGDIRSFECPTGHFSHVIHAATDTQPARTRADRVRVFETIVDGTRRALEAARRCEAGRFLMVSTGAVYGKQPAGTTHMTEDHSGGPDVMLPVKSGAEAKRAAESLCALFAGDGLDVIVARPFAFVGPHLPLDMHYAIGNFIRDALAGGPVRVLGDGTAIRSYMYSSDLAEWLWTMLTSGRSLRPYNVGSERAMTIADAAQAVAGVCGGCAVHVAQRPRPGETIDRYIPSTARARAELGLTETVPFEDALARTVAWYRTRGTSHVAH